MRNPFHELARELQTNCKYVSADLRRFGLRKTMLTLGLLIALVAFIAYNGGALLFPSG